MLAWVLIFSTCIALGSACSCPYPGLGPQRLCRYDLIVRGTALAEYEEREEPFDRWNPLSWNSPYSDFVYTVLVKDAIKVPDSLKNSTQISIRTPVQESLCGTRLSLDVDGIFFGYVNNKGQIRTGLCDPNAAWDFLTASQQKMVTEDLADICSTANPFIGPPGYRP